MLDSEESIELDRMTMKALRLLDEHGGVATTSELKNVMGLDDTDDLNYRKREYLEPAGLIETHQPKPDSPGKFPPAEWRLTEKGSGVVDELQSEETDRRDIAERVELLEEQLDGLQEKFVEIQESENHMESDTSSGAAITEVIDEMEQVKSEVNALQSDPVFGRTIRGELNAAILAASLYKDQLVAEHSEEWFNQKFAEKEQELKLFDLE